MIGRDRTGRKKAKKKAGWDVPPCLFPKSLIAWETGDAWAPIALPYRPHLLP